MQKKLGIGLIVALIIVVVYLLFAERTQSEEPKYVPKQELTQQPAPEAEVQKNEVQQRLFIPDTFNNRIQVFDLNGSFVYSFGEFGFKEGEIRFPADAEYFDGKVYVVDRGNSQIDVFDDQGKFLNLLNINTKLKLPHDLEVFKNRLYVLDTFSNNIKVFDMNGTLLNILPASNSSRNLRFPLGLAIN